MIDDGEPTTPDAAIALVQFRYQSENNRTDQSYFVNFALTAGNKVSAEICERKVELEIPRCSTIHRSEKIMKPTDWHNLRDLLLISRPAGLSSEVPIVMPKGCGLISDAPSVFNVTVGTKGKKLGEFVVQSGDCPGMKVARRYARKILDALPDQALVRQYPIVSF